MHSDTSQRTLYIHTVINEEMLKLFYSLVNNNYSSFRQAHFFPIRTKLSEGKMGGVAVARTPCHDITMSWSGILWSAPAQLAESQHPIPNPVPKPIPNPNPDPNPIPNPNI